MLRVMRKVLRPKCAVAACVGAVFYLAFSSPSHANHVVMRGGPFLGVVLSIAVDPSDSKTLYLAAFGGGLFRSVDSGASWTAINNGLPNRQVLSLIVHPRSPRRLYVGTDQGIFSSEDQGNHWRLLTPALKERNIRALAVDPSAPQALFAATDEGAVAGGPGGWRWLTRGMASRDVRALQITAQGTVYAGTFGGVYKKAKDRSVWAAASEGLEDKKVRALALESPDGETIYAGTATGGVFKSADGGRSWRNANKGLLNSTVLALASAPDPQKALYAGTIDGVFKSPNGGARWFPTGNELALTVPVVAVDPRAPHRVYAGSGGFLFHSNNGGERWKELSPKVNYFGPNLSRQNGKG